jgi:acetyl-CoA acetyltransferase
VVLRLGANLITGKDNVTGVVIASAARTAIGSFDEMERRDLEPGLVRLCIGGGQGIAMLLGRDN